MERRMGLLMLFVMVYTETQAATVPPRYRQIAAQYQIPAGVLYAVALTESGKTVSSGHFRPWPWTLNVAGKPKRYTTRKAAWQAINYFMGLGEQSIDIGLMQINWRWHKQSLGSTWQALDPVFNVKLAAKILQQAYLKKGSWPLAIGSYHSPGKKPEQKRRARAYAARVIKKMKRMTGS